MNQPETELLLDLAKLLKKHGPASLERFSAVVRSPEFRLQLGAILDEVAAVGRAKKAKSKSKAKQRSDLRTTLLNMAEVDAEKSAILVELHDGLKAKSFLPSLRDLRAFASDRELPEVKGASRDKALAPFIQSLTRLPTPVLEKLLFDLQSNIASSPGLEGWSNIILDPRRGRE